MSFAVNAPQRGGSKETSDADLDGTVEVIPEQVYWTDRKVSDQDTAKTHFFCIDDVFVYQPISKDFGPLNLGMIHRYCTLVEKKRSTTAQGKRLVHCCSSASDKRANAVLLVCAYEVVVLRKTPSEAFDAFRDLNPPLRPFCDALANPSDYELTIEDCLEGLHQAIELKWLDFKKFGVKTYEWLGRYTHGDMSWIIPKKLLAFPEPNNQQIDEGYQGFTPEAYSPIFQSIGISTVVRLNEARYDRKRFLDFRLRHIDLEFQDGSCPLKEVIDRFFEIVDSEPGAIAVHCKAGLGRTGTLIGLYAMRQYRFPAKAFIGWCRVCRPGTILGRQQQFLLEIEKYMFEDGLVQDLDGLADFFDEENCPPSPTHSPPGSNNASPCAAQTRGRAPSQTNHPSGCPPSPRRPQSAPQMAEQLTTALLDAGGEDPGQGQFLRGAKRNSSLKLKSQGTECCTCFSDVWKKLTSSADPTAGTSKSIVDAGKFSQRSSKVFDSPDIRGARKQRGVSLTIAADNSEVPRGPETPIMEGALFISSTCNERGCEEDSADMMSMIPGSPIRAPSK